MEWLGEGEINPLLAGRCNDSGPFLKTRGGEERRGGEGGTKNPHVINRRVIIAT